MNKDEMILLKEIVEAWKKEIDSFAGNYISTKYSKLQWEMKEVVEELNCRIEVMKNV
jgi:hypothetical protein